MNKRVVHHREAGVFAGDDLIGRNLHDFGENFTQFTESVEASVVACVYSCSVLELSFARQSEQLIREVQLFGRGLPAGEVKGKSCALQLLIGRSLFVEKRLDSVSGEGVESHRNNLTRLTDAFHRPGAPQMASHRLSSGSTGMSSPMMPFTCNSSALSRRSSPKGANG